MDVPLAINWLAYWLVRYRQAAPVCFMATFGQGEPNNAISGLSTRDMRHPRFVHMREYHPKGSGSRMP